jgi:hypothetical protein
VTCTPGPGSNSSASPGVSLNGLATGAGLDFFVKIAAAIVTIQTKAIGMKARGQSTWTPQYPSGGRKIGM